MSTGERVGAGYAKRTAGMGTRPSKHKKVRVTSLSVCRALGRVLVTKHTQTEHSAEALSRHCTRYVRSGHKSFCRDFTWSASRLKQFFSCSCDRMSHSPMIFYLNAIVSKGPNFLWKLSQTGLLKNLEISIESEMLCDFVFDIVLR